MFGKKKQNEFYVPRKTTKNCKNCDKRSVKEST